MPFPGPILLALWLAAAAPAEAQGAPAPPSPEPLWVAIVLTEAAGEPFECKVGVAEVLRNRRWSPRGFAGIRRRDLKQFLARQPDWAYRQAERALRQVRGGSNLTDRATHFENVEAFGMPAWALRMERTVKLGRLTFFREPFPSPKTPSGVPVPGGSGHPAPGRR